MCNLTLMYFSSSRKKNAVNIHAHSDDRSFRRWIFHVRKRKGEEKKTQSLPRRCLSSFLLLFFFILSHVSASRARGKYFHQLLRLKRQTTITDTAFQNLFSRFVCKCCANSIAEYSPLADFRFVKSYSFQREFPTRLSTISLRWMVQSQYNMPVCIIIRRAISPNSYRRTNRADTSLFHRSNQTQRLDYMQRGMDNRD